MDDAYFEGLHDRIMNQIEQTEVKSVSRVSASLSWLKTILKIHGWTFLQLASASVIFVVFFVKSSEFAQKAWSSSRTVQRAQNDKNIMKVALESPEDLSATFISFQKNEDFLMEVAANAMSDLSHDQFREFIGQKPN
jgi:hypothetical protein